jgi:hypothetical protein
MRRIDLQGHRYNRLLVVDSPHVGTTKHPKVKCLCDCGNEVMVIKDKLRSGHTKSCGCLNIEMIGSLNASHGKCDTSEYRAWAGMLTRVGNDKERGWHRYGGRGITVCERWKHSFENFLTDMGIKPTKKHSIERVDNDGNYEPDNCKWGTCIEQANNKRNNVKIVFESVAYSPRALSEKLGVPIKTAYGWAGRKNKPELLFSQYRSRKEKLNVNTSRV